jgi:hypothetical protein
MSAALTFNRTGPASCPPARRTRPGARRMASAARVGCTNWAPSCARTEASCIHSAPHAKGGADRQALARHNLDEALTLAQRPCRRAARRATPCS